MAPKAMAPTSERSEVDGEPLPVDLVFRRAALIQDSKVSARRRRLGARRRQGTH
jgi:hypothetical protein